MTIAEQVLRTLLYYDIFSHPLRMKEINSFLPCNSIARPELLATLDKMIADNSIGVADGYYFIRRGNPANPKARQQKEQYARRRWIIARMMVRIIKMFPFVRAVLVSGDLAKNVSSPNSDLDFVVITEPRRLWIARTLLILFKKTILLNRRKNFCLNYFVTTSDLEATSKNYFTATEIAHLKPLYNFPLFLRYMNANSWIKQYFPKYRLFDLPLKRNSNRKSIFQFIIELPLRARFFDGLDNWLMQKTVDMWKRRYPQLDDTVREFRFRCTPTESRAFGDELGSRILAEYDARLRSHGLTPL